MQLLADLDGFDNRGDVKIIGATNRIDILDPALLRPGRFDRMIDIPLPDVEGRLAILKIHTKRMNLHKNVDLAEVSALTEGKNGSDLRAICTEAGMFAIRADKEDVDMNDFIKAIDKIRHDLKHGLPDLSDGAMFA
jgi:proteasome regulatory subunit